MALLEILHHPDPRLRTIAQPVTQFDDQLQTIINDMYETMYHAHGAGLAATQVNIHLRLATMDVDPNNRNPICMINPEILHMEGTQIDQHGCLSLPGVPGDKIKRAAKVHFKALDRHGKPFEMVVDETLAICVQHEIDHLNGKLYIHHLSSLKQERLLKKGEKFNRERAGEE